jgi:DNA-binding MarR family transcriptional regulator
MVEDVVRAFGFLTLGSRLKRIGERLQADTQRILDGCEVPIQASQFPFLAALDRLGPLTVGELADAVGITQPGATRTVAQLAEMGLVDSRQARDDQRRRILSLSTKGQKLVHAARRDVWPQIESAVVDLCGNLSGPLLEQLDLIEDGLAAAPLDRRVLEVAS